MLGTHTQTRIKAMKAPCAHVQPCTMLRTRPAVLPRVVAQASAAGKCPIPGVSSAPTNNAPAPRPNKGDVKSLVKVVPEGTTSKLPLPDGPFLMPFFGETDAYLKEGNLRFGLNRAAKYGPVFKTSYFGMDIFQVVDPEMCKAVMAEDTKLVNFDMGGGFAKLQGDFNMRILTNRDNSRMPFRRSLLGSVTNEAMAGYVPKMVDISKAAVAELEAMDQFDICIEARKWGMAFANSLLAGLQTEGPEDEKQLREELAVFFDGVMTWDIDLPGFPLRKALDARDRLLARIELSVQKQLEDILKDQPAVPGQKIRRNMMGYVVDYNRHEGLPLEAKDLAQLALSVLNAGTDTSSGGLSGLVTILAQRPDIWQRLREEQAEVVAKHGPEVNKASLDASKLLDACVREALRFVPPGTGQFRRVLKEFELAGKYRIPAGSWLVFNALTASAIEGDPAWYGRAAAAAAAGQDIPIPECSDIEKLALGFNPDRWLADPTARPTLFTFGVGPHTCLGMSIFIQEAKVLMSHIIRKADIEIINKDFKWVEMPMVKPESGVMMRLKPLAQPMA